MNLFFLETLKHCRVLSRSAALLLTLAVSFAVCAPVESAARPQDSDLSQSQRSTLQQIVGAARETRRSKRATGIGVLFACGEIKQRTAAAEMLAKELGRDVYHVDLSKIVSK